MALSDKHRKFCKALLKHGFNQTRAYMEVYKTTNALSARVNASMLLTKNNIKEYIEKLKEQFNEFHGIELKDHEIQDIQEIEIKDND